MGLSLMEFAFVSEELGRTPLGHYCFNCQAPDVGNMEILSEFGTPEQKRTWLEPLAAGRIRSCFSMTEPEMPGSNPAWMATRARRDGETGSSTVTSGSPPPPTARPSRSSWR